MAREVLEDSGCVVVMANNGLEALERLREQSFDAVLMDVQMPVMDGYTATRAIRSNPQWADLPVIAMTANALASDRGDALAAGMNDHVTKPLDIDHLFVVLRNWLEPRTGKEPDDPTAPPGPMVFRMDKALRQLVGNMTLYHRLLERFRQDETDFPSRLRHVLDDHDPVTALRMTHTLKSVSGTLGAEILWQATKALENALAEGLPRQRIDTLLVDVRSALAEAVAYIDSQASSTAGDDGAPISLDEAGVLLSRLRQLVADDDVDAIGVADTLAGRLRGTTHQDAAQRICQTLAAYDFHAAGTQAAELAALLPNAGSADSLTRG